MCHTAHSKKPYCKLKYNTILFFISSPNFFHKRFFKFIEPINCAILQLLKTVLIFYNYYIPAFVNFKMDDTYKINYNFEFSFEYWCSYFYFKMLNI